MELQATGCTSGAAIEVEADHVEDDERVEQRLHRVVHQLHRRLPASAHASEYACSALEGLQSLSTQATFQPASSKGPVLKLTSY